MSKIFLFRVLTFEVNHLMYMGDKQKERNDDKRKTTTRRKKQYNVFM
jgi:hypothetical protein